MALIALSIAPVPICEEFMNWVGGQPFDYQTDEKGSWNFPEKTELWSEVFFPNAGVQKYYSPLDPTAFYVVIYRTLDATTDPETGKSGQHDVCVARIDWNE